jgi:hypothetical protein
LGGCGGIVLLGDGNGGEQGIAIARGFWCIGIGRSHEFSQCRQLLQFAGGANEFERR